MRTVKLGRRLAGRKYASAALCRNPRRWVTGTRENPVLSGPFSSSRRRIPSSAQAARNANVVGFGSRNSEMNCGPDVPYTPPELLPTRCSARSKYGNTSS